MPKDAFNELVQSMQSMQSMRGDMNTPQMQRIVQDLANGIGVARLRQAGCTEERIKEIQRICKEIIKKYD